MATCTLRQIRGALSEKGFRLRENDHEYYYYCVGDRITEVFTKVSHRNDGDDLRRNEISGMKAQMFLDTQQQVLDFAKCTLTHVVYHANLVAKDKI
jgi:hypothetical protein